MTCHSSCQIKLLLTFKFTYLGCQKTYEKRDGRILFSDEEVPNQEECVFTINVGQQNLTISLYIASFRFSGPATTNYLKVTRC